MKYRKLGNTDLNVSEISLGCMSLNLKNDYRGIINKAIESGINYFDTADLYHFGENEKLVGKSIKQVREKIYIASKVGNDWNESKTSWRWNPTKEYILKSIDESLKRLNTDYLDLYQLHGGTIDDPIDDVIEAFEKLKSSGKIRYWGISSIRPNVVRKYLQKSNFSSNMLQYNILDRRPEEEILPILGENNKGILIRGSLTKGILINKVIIDYLTHSANEVKIVKKEILKLGNPLAVLLKFVLQNKYVTSSVNGFSSITQLVEAINQYEEIGKINFDNIKELTTQNFYSDHR